MFIIAAIREDDPLLNPERERLTAWAAANGWEYIEYVDSVDLLARIADLKTESIEKIDELLWGEKAGAGDCLRGKLPAIGFDLLARKYALALELTDAGFDSSLVLISKALL